MLEAEQLHVNRFQFDFQGILTKEFDARVANTSTCKDSYREPAKNNVRQKGTRLERLEKQLYEEIRYDNSL